jgi:serine/threonine protein kinase
MPPVFRIIDGIPIQLKKRIGEGSFKTVYEGYDTANGRKLAVSKCQATKDSLRELKLLKRLMHPCIVQVLGSCEDGKHLITVMELMTPVDRLGPLKNDDLKIVMKDVLDGLLYLHSQDILHGDVKPGNILTKTLDRGNLGAQLCDFGCAVQNKEITNFNSGTIPFMAPEVHQAGEVTVKADIFSVGGTPLQLTTGIVPWSSSRSEWRITLEVGNAEPETPTDFAKRLKSLKFHINHLD